MAAAGRSTHLRHGVGHRHFEVGFLHQQHKVCLFSWLVTGPKVKGLEQGREWGVLVGWRGAQV